jgi:8-oxo-dGTP diphosphatase
VRLGQEVQALPRRAVERRVGAIGTPSSVILVVAAALYDAHGRVLIAQRPEGKHLAGRWEFPGGKVVPGESESAALVRELREELGIEVAASRSFMRLTHAYADRSVELSMWIVERYSGVPRGLDGQSLKWVAPTALTEESLLEADRPFVEALRTLPAPRSLTSDGG